jgi:IS30 family transposase
MLSLAWATSTQIRIYLTYIAGSKIYCNVKIQILSCQMCKSYTRFSLDERISIQLQLSHGYSYGHIAGLLNRSKSSIQREVCPWARDKYNAAKAHSYAIKGATARKRGKRFISSNPALLCYIIQKLQLRWSPEQISNSLKTIYAHDKMMQISHESIYRYVYLHAKKGLREELIAQLRREKKSRGRPRSSPGSSGRGKIADAISIDERPEEVNGREIPGHWEGDLVVGKDHKSAIGTLVERTTRTIIIVPLTATDATTVRQAFEEVFLQIPLQMRKTMTYDNGKEMTQHKTFTENTKINVYFAHPYSPWERPTNENSNMLIRDYFPKGTDFNLISRERLKEVQDQLNERPRKTLKWKTPKDVFELLTMTA